jgi:hypothetical protein
MVLSLVLLLLDLMMKALLVLVLEILRLWSCC